MKKFNKEIQRGYIKIVLTAFALIIGIMIFPIKFPKDTTSTCILGDPPPRDAKVLRMPVAEDFGPSRTRESDFVMVRSNVPTSDFLGFFKPPDPFLEPNQDDSHLVQTDYDKESPAFGENPQKPGFDEYYPYGGANGKIYQEWETAYIGYGFNVIDLGLVFFRNKDPKTIKDIPSPDPLISHHTYLVDIYQDVTKVSKGPFDPVEELLGCSEKGEAANAVKTPIEVFVPEQNKSPNQKQLQLEWFVFQSNGVWNIHCKPAVYLYPKRKQLVNVKVFPKGELGYTDPPYDKVKGWTVWANPAGNLINSADNSVINQGYLYYESKLLDLEIKKPIKGWVVSFNELGPLFNEQLPKLGLNEKESKDFSDYWLGKLPNSPYYFVGLVEKEQRDYLERLDVTPNPDTFIRFSLFFEMLNEPKEIDKPEIVTPKRIGFTLVDWGGMVILHPGTAFTCSQ